MARMVFFAFQDNGYICENQTDYFPILFVYKTNTSNQKIAEQAGWFKTWLNGRKMATIVARD